MKEFTPLSEEILKFQRLVAEIFVSEVLGFKSFLITEDTSVSDFRPNSEAHAVKKGDKYEFTQAFYDPQEVLAATGKHLWHLTPEELKTFEKTSVQLLEKSEVSFDSDIIEKTKEIFGVTISAELLNGKLSEVSKEIVQKISSNKKTEITKQYA